MILVAELKEDEDGGECRGGEDGEDKEEKSKGGALVDRVVVEVDSWGRRWDRFRDKGKE